jgi:hypothetical protein
MSKFGIPNWAGAAASAAVAVLFSSHAQAASLYIGDDAAEGSAVTSGGGSQADTANPLTYAFTGTGSSYIAANSQTIKLTEVNFFADEGPGNLTPFVAAYSGSGNNLGASYTVLAIGDPIAVTGSTFGSTGNVRENRAFTVGGVNPQITLNAGQTLVAGLYQTTRIVLVSSTAGSNNDYINNGSSLPASTGNTLTSDSDYNLNRTMRYNIGFDVVPEPSALMLGAVVTGLLALKRRRRVVSPI